MIIGIDIDDTISDTYAHLFPYAEKYMTEDLGKNIENVNKNCSTHMYVSTFHNWTEKEDNEFLKKYYKATVENVRPKLFAKETIDKLKEEGNTIFIVTARRPSEKFDVEDLTEKWLMVNEIYYDRLIVNVQDKVELAKNENIEIFVDDSIKNCEEIAKSNIKTFMMNSIINVNYENEKIKRVYSWPHLYQEIKKYIEGGK